jgi:enoyl-CoA hydratase/carnithine racemase
LVNAEALTPSQAVACGFFDEVVPVAALPEAAWARSTALAALHPEAFVATRSRVHEPLLAAARKARLRDEEEWKRGLPFA